MHIIVTPMPGHRWSARHSAILATGCASAWVALTVMRIRARAFGDH
ncbi:hypothetical protein [Micromonospora chokoriensis]